MQRTFPLVDDEGFPHGLRCAVCDRVIASGQPYDEHLNAMIGDQPVVVLTCVYCAV